MSLTGPDMRLVEVRESWSGYPFKPIYIKIKTEVKILKRRTLENDNVEQQPHNKSNASGRKNDWKIYQREIERQNMKME